MRARKFLLFHLALALVLVSACSTPTTAPAPPEQTRPPTSESTPEAAPTPSKRTPTIPTTEEKPMPQGHSPFAMAITEDGQYGYIGFNQSETVFKIRLEDLSVEAVAELYQHFPMESKSIALDASEEKLFVYVQTWRKLLVLDTETMSVIHTIDDIAAIQMMRSRYGPFLLAWDPGRNEINFIDTGTYEITRFRDDPMRFVRIEESLTDEDEWYIVNGGPSVGYEVGIYNHKATSWEYKVSLPMQREDEAIFDLQVLPDGSKAYVGTLGGWYPEYHAYGWLYSIDLVDKTAPKVVPIDGGALCLEASPDSQRLYVGTGWPIPEANNILVLDTQSDTVIDSIDLGRNKYGWPPTETHDLQIDPVNPQILYVTNADANSLVKVDLASLSTIEDIVFSKASLRPHLFVKKPGGTTGYIFISQSNKAFEFDTDTATVKRVVELPVTRPDIYSYSGVIDDAGRLLIILGEQVLEVNPADWRVAGTHPLPLGTPSTWHFILSQDQQRLYSVAHARDGDGPQPNRFVAINASDFQVETVLRLEGGAFKPRLFEQPDGSKLYVAGGMPNGPVVIHVIDTETLTVRKTITFDNPELLGIAQGNTYPFAYDSASRTLFVGATHVVLAINTGTDEIERVIHLSDIAKAIGLDPEQLTYINATALLYNPVENYLYISHVDRGFVSIYDLTTNRFLPQAIPLRGFHPVFMFADEDFSRIYVLNTRSDNISVIDVNSKKVEKVIDLHAYE